MHNSQELNRYSGVEAEYKEEKKGKVKHD